MKKTMHMIGNAHLDPVWLWDWREGFQENKATMKSALDRMDEFDDFIFTSSSAQFYQWIEENDPEMFSKIKERIAEGRWKICGGWWIQPDCNIPSGESFIRQGLIAQNYFKDKFGVTAHTGYCVDSFGHNAMLPQLLKKSGMDNYVFMRPGPHEKAMESRAFIWEAPDGSQVKAFRLPFNYGYFDALEKNMDLCADECSEGVDQMMFFYGVGNHGGGPTINNLNAIHDIQKNREDINVVLSDPDSYFDAIKGCKLPIVKEELQHHAAGCYAAESMIKSINRKSENALLAAEKFSVVANALGKNVFDGELQRGWENLLFNQFHDILAGSSIETAYYDARNQLGETISIADRCKNNAVQSISFDIDIPLDVETLPLVVFNPHSWCVKAPVEFERGMFANSNVFGDIYITDALGKVVPHQYIDPACRVPGRNRFTFMAEVPALGYTVFFAHANGKKPSEYELGCYKLENDKLIVQFDDKTGTIKSIINKTTGAEVLKASASVTVIEDLTDTWGHTLTKLDKKIGEFQLVSAKVIDSGDVRSTIRFTSKYENSTLIQTFSIYNGDDKIYTKAKLNWQEHSKAVKFNFPVNTDKPTAISEIPFGHIIKNTDNLEETMQRWVDVSGEGVGLSIINDGKYSVSFDQSNIGITALRSPVYAQHDPYILKNDEEYAYMDQGISEFSYILKPHRGNFKEAGVINDAELLNQPLVSMFETFHKGTLPLENSYISIDKPNVIMSALKKALNGEDIVIRLYEAYGDKTNVLIKLFDQSVSVDFDTYEVKTFALSKEGAWKEVNLVEWNI